MSKRLLLERSKLKEVESINFESKKKDIQDLHRNIKLAEVPFINAPLHEIFADRWLKIESKKLNFNIPDRPYDDKLTKRAGKAAQVEKAIAKDGRRAGRQEDSPAAAFRS
jgi:hypothetical protein